MCKRIRTSKYSLQCLHLHVPTARMPDRMIAIGGCLLRTAAFIDLAICLHNVKLFYVECTLALVQQSANLLRQWLICNGVSNFHAYPPGLITVAVVSRGGVNDRMHRARVTCMSPECPASPLAIITGKYTHNDFIASQALPDIVLLCAQLFVCLVGHPIAWL